MLKHKKLITFPFDFELIDKLKAMSKARKVSTSELVRLILWGYIRKQEKLLENLTQVILKK